MATSQADIRRWLEEGQARGATHTVVACDTFDYSDFPIHVLPGQSVQAVVSEYSRKEMSRVMEVYCLGLDLESQLKEKRAWHLESAPTPEPAADEAPEGSDRLRPSPLAG